MSTLQVTASKTALFLQCARPFAVERDPEDDSNEASRYGSAFHAVLELEPPWTSAQVSQIAEKWGVAHCIPELLAHCSQAHETLTRWLEGGNPEDIEWSIFGREEHLAAHLDRSGPIDHLWECDFEESTHTYDLRPGEIGGTYDLLATARGGKIVVLDYKTGASHGFESPAQVAQMKTLALLTRATHVAILHAPRGGVPVVYCDAIPVAEVDTHAKALVAQLGRVGDGSMRPGPECKYCPAKESCPTKHAELLARTSAMVTKLTPDALASTGGVVDRGRFLQFAGDLTKLIEQARAEIKADVERGDIIERPDGKIYEIETRSVERLSKKAYIDALGKAAAEKEFTRLRKLNVLTAAEERRLVAK